MKPTYNPSKLRRARKFGFRKRNQTSAGRKVLEKQAPQGKSQPNCFRTSPISLTQILFSFFEFKGTNAIRNQCACGNLGSFHSVKKNGKRYRDQAFWFQLSFKQFGIQRIAEAWNYCSRAVMVEQL